MYMYFVILWVEVYTVQAISSITYLRDVITMINFVSWKHCYLKNPRTECLCTTICLRMWYFHISTICRHIVQLFMWLYIFQCARVWLASVPNVLPIPPLESPHVLHVLITRKSPRMKLPVSVSEPASIK